MKQIVMGAFFTLSVSMAPLHAQSFDLKGTEGSLVEANTIAKFNQPWAMTFLPDRSLLVTTKSGRLFHVLESGAKHPISGLPKIAVGGQGGLGDILAHPNFAKNNLVFISYVEMGEGSERGAVVVRARLNLTEDGGGELTDLTRIWTQLPKTTGRGHFSHRLAFGPANTEHEGKLLITSGDRQLQDPAQEMDMALGKIIRLNEDGTLPGDNPWANGDQGELAKSYWSVGHRNPLGISFDMQGKLWSNEMGPRHGDELNLIQKGENYGWPIVSEGKQYSGRNIPSHDTRPEFVAPKAHWVPSIAPSGLVIYTGKTFPEWNGNAFIGGLVSRALVRVKLKQDTAREVERFKWGQRIREVEQGPDGDLWVLEDKQDARLLRISKGN